MIVEILKMTGVGIVSSFFTYFLASREFRHRKWWELKVNAYKDTIEALSDLVHYFDRNFEAESRGQEATGDLPKIWMACCKKIRRSAYSGAFLFSDEAEIALKIFVKQLNKYPDNYNNYSDYFDAGYGAAIKCLDSLVACSKKDLRLKESFLDKY